MNKAVKPALIPNPFIMYFEEFDQNHQKIIKGKMNSYRSLK